MNGERLVVVVATGAVLLVVGCLVRPRPRPRLPRRDHAVLDAERRTREPSGSTVATIGARLAVAAMAVALAARASAAMLVIAAAGAAAAPTMRRHRTRARRQREIADALPDALDLLAVTIQAGRLPVDALRHVRPWLPAPLTSAFGDVLDRVDRGELTSAALDALAVHLGPPGAVIADALVQSDRAGLAFTPAIERLAAEARHQRRRAAEAAARELPVRLSFPLVLCTLPAFVLVAIVPLLVGALSSVHLA